ncbi:MAG: tetratricopeptide repeat protein, partial [Bacteroidota bacterium]
NFIFILFVSTLLGIWSCGAPTTDQVAIQIPELLDRPEKIRHGIEWQNAHNQYTQASAQIYAGSESPEPWLQLAEVFMLEARVTGEHGHYYPAALQALNKVLTNHTEPDDFRFRALSMNASVMLSQHEFSKALHFAQQALNINRYNAQIFGVMTDALVELGEYDKAVQMADQMVNIRPDLRSYSRVSYLREIYGDVDGAIKAMEMAVAAAYPGHEQSAWTRLTLGDIYNTYGKLDEASVQYETILTERENYPFAIAALADLEMQKGNLAKAEALLDEATAIIPEVGFYIQLADLYQQTQRPAAYEKTMQEIMLMLQDDVDSGHNMNMEYADLHLHYTEDFDQALAFAKYEYEKRPENIDVNRLLAQIYAAQGNGAQAEVHLAKAASTNSKHPDLLALQQQLALR